MLLIIKVISSSGFLSSIAHSNICSAMNIVTKRDIPVSPASFHVKHFLASLFVFPVQASESLRHVCHPNEHRVFSHVGRASRKHSDSNPLRFCILDIESVFEIYQSQLSRRISWHQLRISLKWRVDRICSKSLAKLPTINLLPLFLSLSSRITASLRSLVRKNGT